MESALGLSSDVLQEGVDLAIRSVAFAVAYGILHQVLRPVVRRTSAEVECQNEWINRVVATFHAVVSGPCACHILAYEPPFSQMVPAILRFPAEVNTVEGNSHLLRTMLPFTLGYFLYDLGVMMIEPAVYSRLMVLHHVFSIVVWPMSIVSQAGAFYVVYFIATEVSTPLLHPVVFFFDKHGVGDPVKTLTAAGLLVMFFLCRAGPSPFIWWSLWASRSYWVGVHPFVQWLAMFTIPIPSCLFCFWFGQMILAAIKVVAGGEIDASAGRGVTDEKAD